MKTSMRMADVLMLSFFSSTSTRVHGLLGEEYALSSAKRRALMHGAYVLDSQIDFSASIVSIRVGMIYSWLITFQFSHVGRVEDDAARQDEEVADELQDAQDARRGAVVEHHGAVERVEEPDDEDQARERHDQHQERQADHREDLRHRGHLYDVIQRPRGVRVIALPPGAGFGPQPRALEGGVQDAVGVAVLVQDVALFEDPVQRGVPQERVLDADQQRVRSAAVDVRDDLQRAHAPAGDRDVAGEVQQRDVLPGDVGAVAGAVAPAGRVERPHLVRQLAQRGEERVRERLLADAVAHRHGDALEVGDAVVEDVELVHVVGDVLEEGRKVLLRENEVEPAVAVAVPAGVDDRQGLARVEGVEGHHADQAQPLPAEGEPRQRLGAARLQRVVADAEHRQRGLQRGAQLGGADRPRRAVHDPEAHHHVAGGVGRVLGAEQPPHRHEVEVVDVRAGAERGEHLGDDVPLVLEVLQNQERLADLRQPVLGLAEEPAVVVVEARDGEGQLEALVRQLPLGRGQLRDVLADVPGNQADKAVHSAAPLFSRHLVLSEIFLDILASVSADHRSMATNSRNPRVSAGRVRGSKGSGLKRISFSIVIFLSPAKRKKL
ncbi:ORF088 [Saltwater crocodilepox virus]|nr:ORF088 [Saltwater crocodilepox virus]